MALNLETSGLRRAEYPRTAPGVELLLAGVVGNMADRLFLGYVVDWLHVGVYVNAADVFLCLGGALVLFRLSGASSRRLCA